MAVLVASSKKTFSLKLVCSKYLVVTWYSALRCCGVGYIAATLAATTGGAPSLGPGSESRSGFRQGFLLMFLGPPVNYMTTWHDESCSMIGRVCSPLSGGK